MSGKTGEAGVRAKITSGSPIAVDTSLRAPTITAVRMG
jgi:hypothetical protein